MNCCDNKEESNIDKFMNDFGKVLEEDRIKKTNAVNLELEKLDEIINKVEMDFELKAMISKYNERSFAYNCDFYSKLIGFGKLVEMGKISKEIAQEWMDNISEEAYNVLCRLIYCTLTGIEDELSSLKKSDKQYIRLAHNDYMELLYVLNAFVWKSDFEGCCNNISSLFDSF
jgi:hypothetical protein